MKASVVRLALAFVLVPIIAVYVVPASFCLVNFWESGSCDVSFGWTYSFVLVAFGATAVVGVPLYIVFNRFHLGRWWHHGVIGAIVGSCAAVILNVLDSGFALNGLMILTGSIGFASGLLFWLLAAPKPSRPD